MRLSLYIAIFLVVSGGANALTDDQTCTKMISDNNSADMDKAQCLCMMQLGTKTLDPRLKVLWQEALYYRESRMGEIGKLGISEARLTRQMKKLIRGAKKKCGVNWK